MGRIDIVTTGLGTDEEIIIEGVISFSLPFMTPLGWAMVDGSVVELIESADLFWDKLKESNIDIYEESDVFGGTLGKTLVYEDEKGMIVEAGEVCGYMYLGSAVRLACVPNDGVFILVLNRCFTRGSA